MTSRALFKWDPGLKLVSQLFWHLPELTPETPHTTCMFRFFPTLFSSHEKTYPSGKGEGRERRGRARNSSGFPVPLNHGAEIGYPGCRSPAIPASTSVPPHAAGTVSLSVHAGARLTEELCSGPGVSSAASLATTCTSASPRDLCRKGRTWGTPAATLPHPGQAALIAVVSFNCFYYGYLTSLFLLD